MRKLIGKSDPDRPRGLKWYDFTPKDWKAMIVGVLLGGISCEVLYWVFGVGR